MAANQIPATPELIEEARVLAATGQTLTLSTTRQNTAWAAPVFYLFQPWRFCFFSAPTSRHVEDALAVGQAAGAVFEEGDGWQSIRGLQMSGVIDPIESIREASPILVRYFRKFPFTRELLGTGHGIPDLAHFRQRFNVGLYAFIPSRVVYTNNRIHFGFKAEISLP